MKNKDESFNYSGFSTISGGSAKTRNVKKKATETKTTTTDTKDDNTSTTVKEATLGGDTIPLVTETETDRTETGGTEEGGTETTTNTNAEELITLKDVSISVSEMNESNDKTISERKKLEEEIAKLKEALRKGVMKKKKK